MLYDPHHILNLILPGIEFELHSQNHPAMEKLQSQTKPDLAVNIICNFLQTVLLILVCHLSVKLSQNILKQSWFFCQDFAKCTSS